MSEPRLIRAPAFLYNGARYRSQLDKPIHFRDDQVNIENPAGTYEYKIVGAAIAADRQLNLPLITGADTLMVLGLQQNITALHFFSAGLKVGGQLDNQTLDDASTGTGSTPLYIGNAKILVNNGVNFGPGGVTSITVVGGQITAIS